jgi:thiamine pyrophosphate-dependent acetolactate synthase large subunit-like protein
MRYLKKSSTRGCNSAAEPTAQSVFGYCDFAGIARGFGLAGRTFKNPSDLPKALAEFAAGGGGAVWDFRVSTKVLSPNIRRAHPRPQLQLQRKKPARY